MMVKQCDLVIVVGSPNSSNSNRLCEVARNAGVDAYMIDRAEQLQETWLEGKDQHRYHRWGFSTGSVGAGGDFAVQAHRSRTSGKGRGGGRIERRGRVGSLSVAEELTQRFLVR